MNATELNSLHNVINTLCADDFNEVLNKMKLSEKAINEAADALHKIIFRERKPQAHWVKYGKTSKGRQRYMDTQTGVTVSDTSHSIVKYTKKSYEQWAMYIRCMLFGLSLRAIAIEVGISTTTAFSWRHKMIEAIKDYQEVIYLSGDIQVDETYFLLNMKGPWKNKVMPRSAKKKGEPGVLRGISNEHVCVLIAIDENDQVLAEIVGQGNPLKEDIKRALQGKVAKKSQFTADSKSAYKDIVKGFECSITQIPSGTFVKGEANLAVINQYHGELKTWLRRFKGVSTKHLENYLMWFRFMRYLNYQLPSNTHAYETLRYAISNVSKLKICEIHQKPFPIDIFIPYQHLS